MQTWVILVNLCCNCGVCGLFFPRFEYQYLGNYSEFVSQLYFTKLAVSSAQSLPRCNRSSGMMALTAIVSPSPTSRPNSTLSPIPLG